jgi:hypothetical protein
LSLTAFWRGSPAPSDAPTAEQATAPSMKSGASYLHARAAEVRRDDALEVRARTVAEELNREVGGLAIERRVSLCPMPGVAMRTAYLVDSARVKAFKAAFGKLRGSHGELRLLLTGPWPPYSFVGGTDVESSLSALVRQVTAIAGARSERPR